MTVSLAQFSTMDLKNQWETVSTLQRGHQAYQEALEACDATYTVLLSDRATERERNARVEAALILFCDVLSHLKFTISPLLKQHGLEFQGGVLVDVPNMKRSDMNALA